MAETREQTRRRRAEARERRRSLLTQPFEALDEKAESAARAVGRGNREQVSPVAKTAVAATAAAVAGGLAGAAKAVIKRRRPQDDPGAGEPESREQSGTADPGDVEPESEADDSRDAEEQAESRGHADEEEAQDARDTRDDEVRAESGTFEQEDEDGEEDAEDADERGRDEARDDAGDEDARSNEGGVPGGDLGRVIDSARRQLQELIGTEVESVSSFERVDDGWCVTLEVVEMRRVPDSTDVLSSYQVVLDGDDCNVVRLDRTRRYRRSQVDAE